MATNYGNDSDYTAANLPPEQAGFTGGAPVRRLTRATDGRMIAGVCAGLARRYGWDVNLVRVLFVLSCLLPGPQILAYLALWVIIPADR